MKTSHFGKNHVAPEHFLSLPAFGDASRSGIAGKVRLIQQTIGK
jgi:hypothetical protein